MLRWIAMLALLATGCATSFTGEAHFPGGARACFDRCQQTNMVMAAYVYMGEYSSGCVCQPRAETGGPASADASTRTAASSSIAAASGVMMQMRRNDSNRNNSLIIVPR